MKVRFNIFFNLIKKILIAYTILLSVFMLFRLFILFKYGDFKKLNNNKLDVLNAFYVGGKFDISVITYGFLPLLIFAIIYTISTNKNVLESITKKFIRYYLVFIATIFFILSIIDYFFYNYFNTHVSPVIFGIKNDKTSAVILSLWTDYPVIKIFIVLILVVFLYHKIFKKLVEIPFKIISFSKFNSIIVFLIFGFYFIGMRGTFGMFPLKLDHTTISSNTFINELVLNGPFAFKLAIGLNSEFKNVNDDKTKTLSFYNFKTESEVLSTYYKRQIDSGFNYKKETFKTTLKNDFLKENPPNVIFVLIESFSNHYLDLHSDKLNLLGSLANELVYCDVFRNFTSARNGTIETLESLLINTPNSSVAQSAFSNIQYNSSNVLPFNNAGYNTSYLTGSQLGWRNTGKFIKQQGFKNVDGYSFLTEKYTNPSYFSWGVHDEYLYQHMFDVLQNSKIPQFIFALTISNHTPYHLPEHYVPNKIIISDSIQNKLHTSKKIAKKNFTSYQYAANKLGEFISKIRNSPLGKNTIIVATGDHNERGMFHYKKDQLLLKYSVPLIMYIPKMYKPLFKNLNRFGSHKDIFPTIYNLALSNQTYFDAGNDLFSKNKTNYYFSQNNHDFAANKYGVVLKQGKTIFYQWKDSLNFKGLKIVKNTANINLNKLLLQLNAHGASTMLSVQNDMLKN